MGTSPTRDLAEAGVNLAYESLPPEVVHHAKRLILDSLACTVGAYRLDGSKIIIEQFREMGGTPQATIFATGERTSAANAAFINTQMSNAMDLFDNLMNSGYISGSTVMPAFAAAEKAKASGREFLTAMVTGYEIGARIYLAMSPVFKLSDKTTNEDGKSIKWGLFGNGDSVFPATIAAGKLQHLNKEQMANAMGIAGLSAPVSAMGRVGILQSMPMMKYAPYGLMGWSAIMASQLASKGMTGDTSILDGEQGFWRLMGSQDCIWENMTQPLGEQWWILQTSFKRYPTCMWNRQALDALEVILEKERIRPEDIESIVVTTHPFATSPLFMMKEPKTAYDTMMSLPYAIAMVALGVPGNRWQSTESFKNKKVFEMIRKIRVEVESSSFEAFKQQTDSNSKVKRVTKLPTAVTVNANGTTFRSTAEYARGDNHRPEMRLSDDEIADKFRHYTSDILRSSRIEDVIDAVFRLDSLSDIDEVAKLFRE